MTRREFIGMASVGVVALVVAGRFAMIEMEPEAPAASYPVAHSDAQWRAMLSSAAYAVLRGGGTERPYSSTLLAEHRPGVFACAGCANRLFASHTKYDSHTGWPSFWDMLPNSLSRHDDRSLAMSRTELRCTRCGGHVGHVFDDGPKPTGLRYCMNGVAMAFQPTAA